MFQGKARRVVGNSRFYAQCAAGMLTVALSLGGCAHGDGPGALVGEQIGSAAGGQIGKNAGGGGAGEVAGQTAGATAGNAAGDAMDKQAAK